MTELVTGWESPVLVQIKLFWSHNLNAHLLPVRFIVYVITYHRKSMDNVSTYSFHAPFVGLLRFYLYGYSFSLVVAEITQVIDQS